MSHHLRDPRFGGQARLLVAVVAASSLTACASSGGIVYTPQPFPMPGRGGAVAAPAPATPAPADPNGGTVAPVAPAAPVAPVAPAAGGRASGYALSGTALSLRGAPYRDGGNTPNGFDCSGFVKYVYERNGVSMPRQVRDQFKVGENVDPNRLQPGDLVFFSTVAPGASHVGIMIGGDQFVHAPSERGVVRVESLNQGYWASRFVGARRVGGQADHGGPQRQQHKE